jgi:hypothetical protein
MPKPNDRLFLGKRTRHDRRATLGTLKKVPFRNHTPTWSNPRAPRRRFLSLHPTSEAASRSGQPENQSDDDPEDELSIDKLGLGSGMGITTLIPDGRYPVTQVVRR